MGLVALEPVVQYVWPPGVLAGPTRSRRSVLVMGRNVLRASTSGVMRRPVRVTVDSKRLPKDPSTQI